MKSGTSYWTIPFVIHNLLTFALVIGLQNHLLYKLTKSVTAVAVALPQSQTSGVGGATVAFVESFQFNAFDTTRTTFASSSSPSSSSSFEGAGGTQMSSFPTSIATSLQPLSLSSSSSSSSSSSAAYPTSISTTSSGFHNSKTSRIMSNLNSISSSSIYPLGPTISTPTANLLHTTFRGSSSGSSSSGFTSKFTGMHQSTHPVDYHTATTMGLSSSALPLFKNFMKNTNTHSGSGSSSNSNIRVSSSSNSAKNEGKQQFPLDFTFSKNHWTNSDAAFTGGSGGVGGGSGSSITGSIGGPVMGASGSGNFRLGSSSTSSLSSASSSSVSETERPRIFRNRHHHEQHWGPFFEEPLNSTTSGDNSITTAHLYTEAVLNCRVGMLKDKTVMWVRRTSEKVSLLTVGNVTYSSDPRIRVKFQYPNNWRLLINPTQWDDAGIYMCQVSTHPPRVFTTNLTVIEPPLRLIDDQERDVGDRYYKTGSTIDLQCQVSRSFLYKEKQNIIKSLKPLNGHSSSGGGSGSSGGTAATTNASGSNFNNNNNSSSSNQTKMSASNSKNSKNNGHGGIGAVNGFASAVNGLFPSTSTSPSTSYSNNQTVTDQQSPTLEKQFSNLVFWSKDDEELPPAALKRLSSNDKWLTSRVTITDAKLSDSGNYSCSIGRLFTAIVQVQVLTGELPAAVQHNSATPLAVCNIRSLCATTGGLMMTMPTMMMHLWCWRWRWRWWWGWLIYFATAFFRDYFFVTNVAGVIITAN